MVSFLVSKAMQPEGLLKSLSKRSECNACSYPLNWLQSFPVIGYVYSKGQCQNCRKPIHPAYILTEILAILATILLWILPIEPYQKIIGMILLWALLYLAVSDFIDFRLPNVITISLLVGGLLYSLTMNSHIFLIHIASALFGFLAVIAIAAFYKKARGIDGIGMGDAKLIAAMGAWLGGYGLLVAILLASFSALILYGGGFFLGRKISAMTVVPFGIFLCISFWGIWILKVTNNLALAWSHG